MKPAYCYTLHGMKDYCAIQGNEGASLALEMTVVCRLLLGALDPPLAHPPPPPPSTDGASQLFKLKKLQFKLWFIKFCLAKKKQGGSVPSPGARWGRGSGTTPVKSGPLYLQQAMYWHKSISYIQMFLCVLHTWWVVKRVKAFISRTFY
jgi:hypothetical protein